MRQAAPENDNRSGGRAMNDKRKDLTTRESVASINKYIEQSTGKKAVRIEGKFKFIPQECPGRPPAKRVG